MDEERFAAVHEYAQRRRAPRAVAASGAQPIPKGLGTLAKRASGFGGLRKRRGAPLATVWSGWSWLTTMMAGVRASY